MMLSAGDVALILLTAIICAVGVAAIVLLILRRGRHRSIAFQTLVIVAGAIASIVAATVAVSAEMYLSPHDLQVLLWVIGISAVVSLSGALLVARVARRSVFALRASVERVGAGEVVRGFSAPGKELAALSAELSATSQRLAHAREEIERLDASRRQFFAWISHDLRTPLTGISALSEALEGGAVKDPSAYLRQIRAQVTAMSRLVDDLFELSKIQSGTLRLNRQDVELLDVVSDAVSDVRSLAEARGIRIVHAGVTGQTLYADPHELTRVVVNLLTNGIRYAPAASEILITADRHDDRLIFSVIDRGSGVDSEDLTRIFEIGWRASDARTPSSDPCAAPGAGLGLAIVQGIVEAHGGQVDAENLSGGFRLNVALPTRTA